MSTPPREIRLIAPTGTLGYGFSVADFTRAVEEHRPHVIAVDAGSTDPGPYYLGSGESFTERIEIRRELEILIGAALDADIPLIVGTAGGSGARAHVAWARDIVEELAREHGWSFRLGLVQSELTSDRVEEKLAAGAVAQFDSGEELTREAVRESSRIVAQIGLEPICEVLSRGAQVVLSGRCCDDAIFAALPVMEGFDRGLALHLGKVLECGALAAEPISMDVMLGTIREDHFVLEPGSQRRACTVTSVSAHSLYERENPFLQDGPGGTLDLTETRLEQLDERRVRVSGSRYEANERYLVKLEGARRIGARAISIAGVRCPTMIARIDDVLAEAERRTREYFADAGVGAGEYRIEFHLYGRDAVMKELEPNRDALPHELGLVTEAIAETPELAKAVCHHVAGALLHLDYPGQFNNAGNLAFLHSPAEVAAGDVYEFSVYHLMEVADPLETAEIEIVDIGDTQRQSQTARDRRHTLTATALPLRELASVIRSKNAKPYRLTLDVLFERRDVFEHVRDTGGLTEQTVAAAYGVAAEQITSSFVFDAGMAFKFTLRRPRVQGSIGDSDIYGAQQHAPLLDIAIPWGDSAPLLD